MGLGAAVPHAVAGESLVYEATATTNVSVDGVAAQESTMTTYVLGGEASIEVRQRAGNMTGATVGWPFSGSPTVPLLLWLLLERTYNSRV